MPRPSHKEKITVVYGSKIGLLTAQYNVTDVLHHPAYDTTPPSYIAQGRLWECVCECGKVCMFSEHALANYLVRSCGCLKRGKKEIDWTIKAEKMKLAAERRENRDLIRNLRYRLACLKIIPVPMRDDEQIELVGSQLRSAYAKKANVTKKINLSPDEQEKRRQAWIKTNLGNNAP